MLRHSPISCGYSWHAYRVVYIVSCIFDWACIFNWGGAPRRVAARRRIEAALGRWGGGMPRLARARTSRRPRARSGPAPSLGSKLMFRPVREITCPRTACKQTTEAGKFVFPPPGARPTARPSESPGLGPVSDGPGSPPSIRGRPPPRREAKRKPPGRGGPPSPRDSEPPAGGSGWGLCKSGRSTMGKDGSIITHY